MGSGQPVDWSDSGLDYSFGPRLKCAASTQPYRRQPNDPLFRQLSVFTSDPGAKRGEGSIEQVRLRYEPLTPGPAGSVFAVDNRDGSSIEFPPADLETGKVLLNNGYRPSLSSPQFQAQMVYAVCSITYESFREALGRPVSWAFLPDAPAPKRLTIRPYGAYASNAWYDPARGELVFGYFAPKESTPTAQAEKGRIFTSLSHDIIVHEMSHALLDGLRSHFLQPTHHDVLALHEAFADLMAFFQQFQFEKPVRSALLKSKGTLIRAEDLVTIAQEFGQGLGMKRGALRTLVDYDERQGDRRILQLSDEHICPHERGSVLVRAIVSAFCEIFEKRTRRYVRLASAGRVNADELEISEPLLDLLVREVAKLAKQFQAICIRAIDYCPPVDVRFGDFLRALVTADIEQVPDDDLGYRETLIRSFGERGIFGEESAHMTEEALRWNVPRHAMALATQESDAIGQLALGLSHDAAVPALQRLANAVGEMVIDPHNSEEFGLVSPRSPDFDPAAFGLPEIASIAIARRVGLDQTITNDLVAEIVQRRRATVNGQSFDFFGGATIIMDYEGKVRFAVRKRVSNNERVQMQASFIANNGAAFWESADNFAKPVEAMMRTLCASQ